MTYVTTADRMLIGGQLVHSSGGEFDYSINPATEETIGRSPRATKQDVERAVQAAEAAWPSWAALAPSARRQNAEIRRCSTQTRRGNPACGGAADTGNTVTPMRGDVGMAVDSLDYYAGLIHELKGETIPATHENLHLTLREPYGVVARIAPFNHPLMFAVAELRPRWRLETR